MIFLDKIQSERIQAKIEAILKNRHPLHNDRLWLVGFLNFVGYTLDEIVEIISQGNQWFDYDKQVTKYQIESTIYGANRRVPFAKGGDSRNVARSRALSPPPEAFGRKIKDILNFESDVLVRCGYTECKEYGECYHSHVHFMESRRIGNSCFSWCGTCPIQEVRCLPVNFDGVKELCE